MAVPGARIFMSAPGQQPENEVWNEKNTDNDITGRVGIDGCNDFFFRGK